MEFAVENAQTLKIRELREAGKKGKMPSRLSKAAKRLLAEGQQIYFHAGRPKQPEHEPMQELSKPDTKASW